VGKVIGGLQDHAGGRLESGSKRVRWSGRHSRRQEPTIRRPPRAWAGPSEALGVEVIRGRGPAFRAPAAVMPMESRGPFGPSVEAPSKGGWSRRFEFSFAQPASARQRPGRGSTRSIVYGPSRRNPSPVPSLTAPPRWGDPGFTLRPGPRGGRGQTGWNPGLAPGEIKRRRRIPQTLGPAQPRTRCPARGDRALTLRGPGSHHVVAERERLDRLQVGHQVSAACIVRRFHRSAPPPSLESDHEPTAMLRKRIGPSRWSSVILVFDVQSLQWPPRPPAPEVGSGQPRRSVSSTRRL